MESADKQPHHALALPAHLREAARELADRLGGHLPEEGEPRSGSTVWAPFGFVPLLVQAHGARGLFMVQGGDEVDAARLPVAWWDGTRGQIAPLAGDLLTHLALVRDGLLTDRPLSEGAARSAFARDPASAVAAVALAGHLLDAGRQDEAETALLEAASAAAWWMAPCLLLVGLLRLQGRRSEAARWCAEALSRRWDATGAGLRGLVPRLGDEPRRLLRSAVAFLRRHEGSVPGLCFDAAWRPVREAADPLDASAHATAAAELERTGRLREAAARWEWLALAHGDAEAARSAEDAHSALGWPLHRSHSRLLRLAAAR